MNESTWLYDYGFSLEINHGFFRRLLSKLGLGQQGLSGIKARAIAFVAVTYCPLALLSLWQGVAYGSQLKIPFLLDVSEATRFLVVGPLLILSEALVLPWLTEVVRHVKQRLIVPDQAQKFADLVEGAIRWRDSNFVECLLLAGTFLWQWIDALYAPGISGAGTWQVLPSQTEHTYTWFWYFFFAKPLIRFLWLRWLWRYLIWSVLLVRLACLKLKTMPTHPDRHAGLGFIAVGHGKFSILALAFGAQAASIFGEQIMVNGRTLMSFRYDIVSVVLLILFIFLTPLLAFTGKLLDAKRSGLFAYGELADEYTEEFHKKWVRGQSDEALLGTSDIQSLADLGNSYEVVEQMKVCLINKDILVWFMFSTLLPFAPLLLTVYPFDELLKHLLKAVM
jgi:hypothetical protein